MSFIKRAEKIKQAYDEIVAKWGEPVTAQKLLDYSTPENSITHNMFEWDDAKAGQQYRIWQARQMLAELEIVVGEYTIRETINIPVPVGEGEERGYWKASTIANNKELREKAIQQMKFEAQKFYNRWKAYEEVLNILSKPFVESIEKSMEKEFTTVAE